ncbi:MAG: NusG domain II-containing protein [Eubacterium sp.]|nr:NusG domain II-containing protein [Eubacterium sp.]
MNKKSFGRNDLLLILGIAAAAILMLLAYYHHMRYVENPMLEITVDNKTYGIYDLDKDARIQINDTNVCEIHDGTVRMISADCPDQVCVHSSPLTKRGGSIVCLPNRVVLRIIHAEKSDGSGQEEKANSSLNSVSSSSAGRYPQIDSLAE